MTAICAAYTDTGVIIASDGAQYNMNTGTLNAVNVSKIRAWPELSMVTGSIGSGPLGVMFETAIVLASIKSFDDLVYQTPTLLAAAFRELQKAQPGMPRREYDGMMFLAGMSVQRSRFEMYTVETHLESPKGSAPFKLNFVEQQVYASATSNPEIYEEYQVTIDALNACADENDLSRLVCRAICAARQMSAEMPVEGGATDGGPETFHWAAGGMIQLTKLQPYQVHSAVLHKWPEDQAGERLDPTKGDAKPAGFWEGLS